jgi:hypothetical protein
MSAMVMMSCLPTRKTVRVMVGLPSKRTRRSSSTKPSVTRATSRTRTTEPESLPRRTMSRTASARSSTPMERTATVEDPPLTEPPGSSAMAAPMPSAISVRLIECWRASSGRTSTRSSSTRRPPGAMSVISGRVSRSSRHCWMNSFIVRSSASPEMESTMAGRLGSTLSTVMRSDCSGRSCRASISRLTSATARSMGVPSTNSALTMHRPSETVVLISLTPGMSATRSSIFLPREDSTSSGAAPG